MIQESWYQMMGISKILLRNIIIGLITIQFVTIVLLSNLLLKTRDRLEEKDVLHKKELILEKEKALLISEEKNEKYILLLREALRNQAITDQEILKLKKRSLK